VNSWAAEDTDALQGEAGSKLDLCLKNLSANSREIENKEEQLAVAKRAREATFISKLQEEAELLVAAADAKREKLAAGLKKAEEDWNDAVERMEEQMRATAAAVTAEEMYVSAKEKAHEKWLAAETVATAIQQENAAEKREWEESVSVAEQMETNSITPRPHARLFQWAVNAEEVCKSADKKAEEIAQSVTKVSPPESEVTHHVKNLCEIAKAVRKVAEEHGAARKREREQSMALFRSFMKVEQERLVAEISKKEGDAADSFCYEQMDESLSFCHEVARGEEDAADPIHEGQISKATSFINKATSSPSKVRSFESFIVFDAPPSSRSTSAAGDQDGVFAADAKSDGDTDEESDAVLVTTANIDAAAEGEPDAVLTADANAGINTGGARGAKVDTDTDETEQLFAPMASCHTDKQWEVLVERAEWGVVVCSHSPRQRFAWLRVKVPRWLECVSAKISAL